MPQQHHDITPDKASAVTGIFRFRLQKKTRFATWLITALLLVPALPAFASSVTTVVYPAGEIAGDTRYRDVIELLNTALEKTRPAFGPYTCQPSQRQVPKKRVMAELASNENGINVLWNPGSVKLEKEFLAIKIPLRKGLLGYRVMLIRKDKQTMFDAVRSVEDLKKIRFGQGTGWIDNAIYQHQGLPLVEAPYPQLFAMLDAERFDAFPRGIGEILDELEMQKEKLPNLAVEKNLLLYYPFPYYFFFNKKDAALKHRVETGLKMMLKDGSFDAIFIKYHQQALQKLDLRNRRVIALTNPDLSPDTPLQDNRLWYKPVVINNR